jgi:orotidine-5'-phosphate decarboxylase
VPGVGAQGGDLAAVMANGLDAKGGGLIINVSRQVLYASKGADFAEAAGEAARRLRDDIEAERRRARRRSDGR